MIRLKELRKENALTQEHLAKKIGITRGAYANIENGRREPDLNTLTILSNLYGVSFDYLVGRTDAKKESPSEDELSQLVLQDDVMKDIYDAVVDLSPENRRIILAQIRAVQRLEADAKK